MLLPLSRHSLAIFECEGKAGRCINMDKICNLGMGVYCIRLNFRFCVFTIEQLKRWKLTESTILHIRILLQIPSQ